jgi:hypothetical protein
MKFISRGILLFIAKHAARIIRIKDGLIERDEYVEDRYIPQPKVVKEQH